MRPMLFTFKPQVLRELFPITETTTILSDDIPESLQKHFNLERFESKKLNITNYSRLLKFGISNVFLVFILFII